MTVPDFRSFSKLLLNIASDVLIIFSSTKMKFWRILILLLLVSCSSNTNNDSRNNDIIVLNVDKVLSDNKLLYSNFFNSCKIIPLETNESCLIGQIDQIFVANDELFILDSRSAKSVFVFTKNGKFIRKIGKLGRGPGEYTSPSTFKINDKRKEIYILDRNYQVIHRYDYTGRYQGNIKISGDRATDFIMTNQNQLYLDLVMGYGDNKYLLRELSFNGIEFKKWFPTPEYGKGWSFNLDGKAFCQTQQDIKFYKPYLDTIYSIYPNEVIPFMCLSSDNLLTSKDLMEIKSTQKINNSSRGLYEINKIWGPTDYYEDNNLIFLVVNIKSSPYFILFNKQNKNSLAVQFFNFDDDLAYAPHTSPPFIGFTQTEFIKVIRPTEITNFKKKLMENKKLLIEDEKIKLEQTSELSNPILIFYETKNEW